MVIKTTIPSIMIPYRAYVMSVALAMLVKTVVVKGPAITKIVFNKPTDEDKILRSTVVTSHCSNLGLTIPAKNPNIVKQNKLAKMFP